MQGQASSETHCRSAQDISQRRLLESTEFIRALRKQSDLDKGDIENCMYLNVDIFTSIFHEDYDQRSYDEEASLQQILILIICITYRPMISDYILKDIDNIFEQKMSFSKSVKPLFARQNVKRDASPLSRTPQKISQQDQRIGTHSPLPRAATRLEPQPSAIKENSIPAESQVMTSKLKSYAEIDRDSKLTPVRKSYTDLYALGDQVSPLRSRSPLRANRASIKQSHLALEANDGYENYQYAPPTFGYKESAAEKSPGFGRQYQPSSYASPYNPSKYRENVGSTTSLGMNNNSNHRRSINVDRAGPSPSRLTRQYTHEY